ncbi:MAG: FlgD immunoglobulin-like domain containing protein [Thermoleophilia bacterium]
MADAMQDQRGDRLRRRVVVAAMAALFVLAIGIFVLPFAFPTPPPIITRFQSTVLFSPNGDHRRDIATVNVRVHQPSTVSLEIVRSGEVVATLSTPDRVQPRGSFIVRWNGRGPDGAVVPDGDYGIKLVARSGRKKFETSRRLRVDTVAPRPAAMTVTSAGLGAAVDGACRVTYTSHDAGGLTIDVRRDGADEPVARFGPRPVRPDAETQWTWDGDAAGGARVAPGVYVVRTTLADSARNVAVRERTCWSGGVTGRPLPARPRAGRQVGAALRTLGGAAVPAGTPVTMVLRRRAGVPGRTLVNPLGDRVGRGARGPLGDTRVTIPEGVNPAALWLVVTTVDGTDSALIPLGATP